jgi:hypothetical protein
MDSPLRELVRHEKACVPPTWAVDWMRWSDDGRYLFAPPWRLDVKTTVWERHELATPPRRPRAPDTLPSGFVGRRAVPLADGRWLLTRAYRPPGRGVSQKPPPSDRSAELIVVDAEGNPVGAPLWAGHADPPEFLAASSRYLVANAEGLKVWNATTLEPAHALEVGTPGALAVSNDGGYVAVAESSRVTVWQTSDWTVLHRLNGHTHPVQAIAFHPTRPLLATGTHGDGQLRTWSLETGETLNQSEIGPIQSLSFSPDGDTLMAAVTAGAGCLVELSVPAPPSPDPETEPEPEPKPEATSEKRSVWTRLKQLFKPNSKS